MPEILTIDQLRHAIEALDVEAQRLVNLAQSLHHLGYRVTGEIGDAARLLHRRADILRMRLNFAERHAA